MKALYLIVILFVFALGYSCEDSKAKNIKLTEIEYVTDSGYTCTSYSCLQDKKNTNVTIEGVLRKYTPNKVGKGAGVKFWKWELLLDDSVAIPVVDVNKKLFLSFYENKEVTIYANLFYGIIIGGNSKPDDMVQQAKGFRIDAISIKLKDRKM